MATDPRTIELRALRQGKLGLDNLVTEMLEGRSVLAPHIRKAIDNLGEAENILHLDGEIKKRYEAFKKVVEATDKKEQTIEFAGVPGVRGEGVIPPKKHDNFARAGQYQEDLGAGKYTRSEAEKIINTVEGTGKAEDRYLYRNLGEKDRSLMGKLFEDYRGITDMGHRDLSILIGSMSLLLMKMDAKDPRRAKLRALMVVTKEVDKLTKDPNLSINQFVNLHKEQLQSPIDVSVDAEIAVKAFRGIKGSVDYTMELRDINNKKSQLSTRLGKMYNALVNNDPSDFDKVFKGINITQLSGSPTIGQHIGAQIRDILDPNAKPKNAKVKPKSASGGRSTIGKGKTKKPKSAKLAAIRLKNRQRRPKLNKRNFTITSLLGILNEKLPGTVARNMGAPRLENVTGRFAQSVRAVDVNVTPQGFPSVGYKYQSDPYSVYEKTSGTRFADAGRDPRTLIDASIREIAAQTAVGRIFTRRIQ